MKDQLTTRETVRSDAGDAWPVIARLVDVDDRPPRENFPALRAAAAGFVSYRVDPPQANDQSDRSANTIELRRPGAVSRPAAPHIVQRAAHEIGHVESPILPRTNPFAIPAASLQDSLAPAIRFIVLFVLFTVAGTWLLSSRPPAESTKPLSEPTTTAAQPPLDLPILQPSAEEVVSPEAIELPKATPTASGPLGPKSPRTGWRSRHGKRSTGQNPQSAVGPPLSPERRSLQALIQLPQLRATDLPPQQTIDEQAAPELARLNGYIFAAPPQQAQYDDNQSSLY